MSPDLIPVIVLVPFVGAILALILGRSLGTKTGMLMVLAAASSLVMSLIFVFGFDGDAVSQSNFEWIPGIDVSLRFRADSFGLFFAMLVSGIGTCVGIYSLNYISGLSNARVGRYYAALIGFMGAMLGIALSDDLILTFIFWEITSITSFMLIGFWYEKEDARKGALTALQVTGLGGLAMMVGFLLVYQATGTFTISYLLPDAVVPAELIQNGMKPFELLTASPLFVPALLCIFAGAFTKSAQWPFHFWLPNAMVAPTPVSTYLHSATMVKAGVFLVGRMSPIFSTAPCWSPILITLGGITFFYTAYQALREYDLKAILARTTLSTLGLVMMIYGLKMAEQDALQLLNHAAYKATLFLCAGIIEHAVHTRDIRLLGGLRHKMPITRTILVLAALSMAGLPPFFGFLSKETLYAGLLATDTVDGNLKWFIIGMSVLANAFIFAVSFKLIFGLFGGEETEKAKHAHEAPKGLWVPAAIVVSFAVVLGVLGVSHLPGNVSAWLSSSSDPDALDQVAHMTLLPWNWHLQPVLLSLATIGIGTLIYKGRRVVVAAQDAIANAIPTMQSIWDRMLAGVTWFATKFAKHWQRGSLRWYFTGILGFLAVMVLMAFFRSGLQFNDLHPDIDGAPWFGVVLCGMLCFSAAIVVRAKTRLQAAVAATATGFLTSLVFVVYRSPDILLTQILIETVSTIFVLLILYFMPPFRKEKFSPLNKMTSAVVACGVGLAMFLCVLFATDDAFREKKNLSGEYLTRALKDADGQNAVNVIIVDFRAIDTTGEILVLVVVGMLVFGLLRSRRLPQAETATQTELAADSTTTQTTEPDKL